MFLKSHIHTQPKWAECSSRRKYLWRQHLFVIVSIWQRQEMKGWNEPQPWIPSSVFSNPKLSRLGREAFLSWWGESSRGERRSLQLPHPLRPGSPFKGSALWEKARAHWPIFVYSLMSCKLVFLKIKSKKVFWFLFVWNTSRQSYLLSLFLCWLLNIFGLDGNVFIPRPSLIINVLIIG